MEDAKAKYKKYLSFVDYIGVMAKLGSYLNLDLSSYPLDEEFVVKRDTSGGQGIYEMIDSV